MNRKKDEETNHYKIALIKIIQGPRPRQFQLEIWSKTLPVALKDECNLI